MSDVEATLRERGNRYGSFLTHARIAQNIKSAMQGGFNWNILCVDQKQALETIADKIARILNGDPNYVDNWHDIAGYAVLVEKRLTGDQECQQSQKQNVSAGREGNLNLPTTPTPRLLPL